MGTGFPNVRQRIKIRGISRHVAFQDTWHFKRLAFQETGIPRNRRRVVSPTHQRTIRSITLPQQRAAPQCCHATISAGDVIRIQTSPLTLSGALPGSLARGTPSDLEPSRLSGNQDGLRIHPLSHVRFGNPVSTRRAEPEGMLFSDASSAPARESSARNSPAL